MQSSLTRRGFLKASSAALALAAAGPHVFAAEEKAARPRRPIKRGIMWGTVCGKGSRAEKMKAGKEGNGIMPRHAMIYTDAQLKQIAGWFASQK